MVFVIRKDNSTGTPMATQEIVESEKMQEVLFSVVEDYFTGPLNSKNLTDYLDANFNLTLDDLVREIVTLNASALYEGAPEVQAGGLYHQLANKLFNVSLADQLPEGEQANNPYVLHSRS